MDELDRLLKRPAFPRSSTYDAAWMLDNHMGPNALWLCEWLCEALPLERGMRVLDLGCGRAMSSIFLARELGVRVWAADLWMGPNENWRRAQEAGVGDLVCPVKAEAHALPFAEGFFDAVVSIDAYHYFGTDQLYLGYLSRFVREGGVLGVVVPGLTQAFGPAGVPGHLTAPASDGERFWQDGLWCFETAASWAERWRRCGSVEGVAVDTLPDGWRHWRDFQRALELAGRPASVAEREALERDQGRFLGFHRIRARRSGAAGMNLYHPGLGALVGLDG